MRASLLPDFGGNVAASVNNADHLDSCRRRSVEDVMLLDDKRRTAGSPRSAQLRPIPGMRASVCIA